MSWSTTKAMCVMLISNQITRDFYAGAAVYFKSTTNLREGKKVRDRMHGHIGVIWTCKKHYYWGLLVPQDKQCRPHSSYYNKNEHKLKRNTQKPKSVLQWVKISLLVAHGASSKSQQEWAQCGRFVDFHRAFHLHLFVSSPIQKSLYDQREHSAVYYFRRHR